MKSINLGEYEYGDLIRFLEKYKCNLITDIDKTPELDIFDDRYFDLERINLLLDRIKKNNYKPDYQMQRSNYKQDLNSKVQDKSDKEIGRINIWK